MEYDGEAYGGEQPDLGEWDIAPLDLEHKGEKGRVEFRSGLDLDGSHIARLRRAVGNENRGEAANALYAEALALLVVRWDIPGLPNLPIPKQDKKNLLRLPAVCLRAMERQIRPVLDKLMKEDQGDPYQPASD